MPDETASTGPGSTADDPEALAGSEPAMPAPPAVPAMPVYPPPPEAGEPSSAPAVAATEPVAAPEPVAARELTDAPTVPVQPAPPAAEMPPPPAPVAPVPVAPVPVAPTPAGSVALKSRATAILAATQSSPKRKALTGLGLGVVFLVLLGAIGYAVWDRFYADPTRNAVAGHCLGGLPIVASGEDREVRNARIVRCDDPAAVYLVEARLDNVTEEQARDRDICRGYRHATDIYRAVPPGGTGYVLCLSRTVPQ